jgi:chromate transporter
VSAPEQGADVGAEVARVRLRDLAWVLLVRANFTYGGGSATVATLRREVVDRRRWLPGAKFQLAYALSRLTPGTNSLAFIACIGDQLRGAVGTMVAVPAGSIPCAAIALGLTAAYASWGHSSVVDVMTRGALAAAVAVTVIAGVTLIRPYRKTASKLKLAVFGGGAFAAAQLLGLSPLIVLAAAAVGGLAWPSGGERS